MRKKLCMLLAATVGLTPGCGTIFFHNPVDVRVHSNVNEAIFTAPGEGRVGRNNGVIELDRTRDHTIAVTAPGYETRYTKIESSFSWWRIGLSVVMNCGMGFFTFFIWPFLGIPTDLGAGSWQCLETSEITVDLVPGGPPPVRAEPEPTVPDLGPDRLAPSAPPSATPTAAPAAATDKPCGFCGEPRGLTSSLCPHCGMK